MITRSKAPLRLGLAGGGTDVSPYCDEFGGYVINATINLYAHCSISDRVDGRVVFEATDFQEKEELEAKSVLPTEGTLKLHKGIYNRIVRDFNKGCPLPVTVTTYCEAPPGSGLGSSSTLVVAIVQAYAEHLNLPLGEYDIAHLAYEIERVDLNLRGGKQDQYAATFGGFNFMEFYGDNRVIVNPLRIKPWIVSELEASLVLLYTGRSRESDVIIGEQIANVRENKQNSLDAMHMMKQQTVAMKESILKGKLNEFAKILKEGWDVKKKSASTISNPHIEEIYQTAINAGAIAGKVSGAGGGGFMMFMTDPTNKMGLVRALKQIGETNIVTCNFSEMGAIAWRTTLQGK